MYGLTESGPLASYNRPDHRKPYSVGTPIWGTEMQIWDNQNIELPPGRDNVGEIVIRGHNTMGGYLNNDAATAEAFAGGWLHSGDLGYSDEDGFLFIVDRKKEMIIRGGYNVYPREVEEVLYTHPAVFEVAVVGVPDERLGEEVAAFVVPQGGSLRRSGGDRRLRQGPSAAYKYPRTVTIIRRSFPRASPGRSSNATWYNLVSERIVHQLESPSATGAGPNRQRRTSPRADVTSGRKLALSGTGSAPDRATWPPTPTR